MAELGDLVVGDRVTNTQYPTDVFVITDFRAGGMLADTIRDPGPSQVFCMPIGALTLVEDNAEFFGGAGMT